MSILGSISLVDEFSNIDVTVNIAFLANYDLNESTNFINSFSRGYYNEF
jgi:hypothetical protein